MCHAHAFKLVADILVHRWSQIPGAQVATATTHNQEIIRSRYTHCIRALHSRAAHIHAWALRRHPPSPVSLLAAAAPPTEHVSPALRWQAQLPAGLHWPWRPHPEAPCRLVPGSCACSEGSGIPAVYQTGPWAGRSRRDAVKFCCGFDIGANKLEAAAACNGRKFSLTTKVNELRCRTRCTFAASSLHRAVSRSSVCLPPCFPHAVALCHNAHPAKTCDATRVHAHDLFLGEVRSFSAPANSNRCARLCNGACTPAPAAAARTLLRTDPMPHHLVRTRATRRTAVPPTARRLPRPPGCTGRLCVKGGHGARLARGASALEGMAPLPSLHRRLSRASSRAAQREPERPADDRYTAAPGAAVLGRAAVARARRLSADRHRRASSRVVWLRGECSKRCVGLCVQHGRERMCLRDMQNRVARVDPWGIRTKRTHGFDLTRQYRATALRNMLLAPPQRPFYTEACTRQPRCAS